METNRKTYAAPSLRTVNVAFEADFLVSPKGTLPGATGWDEDTEGGN